MPAEARRWLLDALLERERYEDVPRSAAELLSGTLQAGVRDFERIVSQGPEGATIEYRPVAPPPGPGGRPSDAPRAFRRKMFSPTQLSYTTPPGGQTLQEAYFLLRHAPDRDTAWGILLPWAVVLPPSRSAPSQP
jgi:hypothetical protein